MNWFKRSYKHSLNSTIRRLTSCVQIQTRKLNDTPITRFSQATGIETTRNRDDEALSVLKSLAIYRMFLASCRDTLIIATTGKNRFLEPHTTDVSTIDLATLEFITGMIHATFKSQYLSGIRSDLLDLHRALSPKPEIVSETLFRLKQPKAPDTFWPISKTLFCRIGDAEDIPAQIGMATFLGESSVAFLDFMGESILKESADNLRALILSEPPFPKVS